MKPKLIHLWNKITIRRLAIIAAAVLVMTGIMVFAIRNNKEQVVYRETTAVKGNLTVGVTESGNVSIGTSEQIFDLDISDYTGTDNSFSWNSNGSLGGSMGPMFQNGSVLSDTSGSSSSNRSLDVEAVYVTAGSEIKKGEALLKLTDSSLSSIRQELEEDRADAKITYDQNVTSQKQVSLQAKAGLDSNTAYGVYADAEYNKTVAGLTDSIEELQNELAAAKEDLEERSAEWEEMKILLAEQQAVLTNAEYARDNTSREDNLYWWIVAVNTVSDTKDLIDTLEEEMEAAEEEMEELHQNIESLDIQIALADKALLSGKEDAKMQKELRQFQFENAQEIYDVTVQQSDFEAENAEKDYKEADDKLKEFDSMIKEGVIYSQYSGIISEVGITAGDSLEQDSTIIILNDYADAAIALTVDEDDMEAAKLGSIVNITFPAFPDEIFKGEVTEIGDAQINSNTNKTTYSITVSVTGEISDLYEGMTAEVTLITEESEVVVYVSNRAISIEGADSYIKKRDSKGNVVKQKVTTGFSDGVNVEIKEGLSEGDIVLIER